MQFKITDLCANDIAKAAVLWERGWHEAHATLVPPELVKLRTSESFAKRLENFIGKIRISIDDSEVLGICMTKEDELYQMYVAPQARGAGLAQALMLDAESRLAEAGHNDAWLACAVGNDRAARFYAKAGWRNAGLRTVELDTMSGPFPLKIWRYEKIFS
ncbi:GNAT family N-acetyltransferase [Yoonia algicola]|uniref:GNAT family N-acetyltransferase n=1 Tax=Yoonia algicola TaxID=3137368 RepID=A0AAN0M2A1_9RHOB